MNKDEHYESTRRFMKRSALERDGFYDAADGGATRHTVWQRRIRTLVLHRMAALMRKDPGIDSVVDVGCGRGDFTMEIAGRFPALARAEGVDFVEETLEIGRRLATDPRIRFTQGDVLSLPFADAEFGVVACINTLHHVHAADQEQALAELARIARGPVILEIKNFASLYYKHIHSRNLGGVEVYPTTARAVSARLGDLGYALTRRTGIFGLAWLSPLEVLVFERP